MLKSQMYLPFFEMVIVSKNLSEINQNRFKEYLKEVEKHCHHRIEKYLEKEKEVQEEIAKYPTYVLKQPDIKKIIDKLEQEKLKHTSTIEFFSNLLVEVSTFNDFSNLDALVKLSCFRQN